MRIKMKGLNSLLLSSLLLASSVTLAAVPNEPVIGYVGHTPGYFELIGAASLSQAHIGNSSLVITTDETDTLNPSNDSWDSWGGQLGIGYVYFFRNAVNLSPGTQWFPMIEPQINAYYSKYLNKGGVFRFQDPAFNDLNYTITIPDTRLMADVALTVVSWRRLSLYAKAGVGYAWNRVSYRDSVNSGDLCGSLNLNLAAKTTSNFAWETGAGVAYALSNHVKLSLEYLYTDFGKVKTSTMESFNGSSLDRPLNPPLISPASFNLHTQGVLLGLHVAFA